MICAQVVELVDTLVSGASAKSMLVRVQSWAPKFSREVKIFRAKRARSAGQVGLDGQLESSRNSIRFSISLWVSAKFLVSSSRK